MLPVDSCYRESQKLPTNKQNLKCFGLQSEKDSLSILNPLGTLDLCRCQTIPEY